MDSENIELLEEMARDLGCQYLSDLRHCGAKRHQVSRLLELGRLAGDRACLEAAEYILGSAAPGAAAGRPWTPL